jgi:hypothetical protein
MIIIVEKSNLYPSKVRTVINIFSDSLTYFLSVILIHKKEKKYFKITDDYEYERNYIHESKVEVSFNDLLKYIKRKSIHYRYRNRPLVMKEEEVSKLLKYITSNYSLEPWVEVITNEIIPYNLDLLYRFRSLIS